jgi:aldose 1-epimerase
MHRSAAITQKEFGITPAGERVAEYELINAQGTRVKVINWGGIITEFWTADKHGKLDNVVLGFAELEPYLQNPPFFGALIGRVGNRIANAAFMLEGNRYTLAANNGKNNLHGGPVGFDKKVWAVIPFKNDLGPGLELRFQSHDGDQGFPGNLSVRVTYQLSHDNEWITDFYATTDKATPVNLTQHSYFNLAGHGDILNHKLQIFADHFTPVNAVQIPLGHLVPVEGTVFDFRDPHLIGERINVDDEQLNTGGGYDHNYVINQSGNKALRLAARVEEATSGRVLELFTQEPGIQFYSGNSLNATFRNQERIFHPRTGFCLEPQHFPDSPNQPQFPSIILQPGEEYKSRTIFKFSAR